MDRKWTKQQNDAIISQKGSVLVSAAAGSGKTAVLVERVIRRITDEANPCDADRLLIVTFTKAAASEMKEKIIAALDKKIRENKDNGFYGRQKILLQEAQICTIDSFCNSLVKEHFAVLGISPDFRIGDEKELSMLSEEAMGNVLEELYKKNDPEFTSLVELLFKGRDDSELANCILKLYDYSRAYPYPEKWLDNMEESYNPVLSVSETCWGREAVSYARAAAEYCLSVMERMDIIIESNPEFAKSYNDTMNSDRDKINRFLSCLELNRWDEALCVANEGFCRKKPDPKGSGGTPASVSLKTNRDIIKETFNKKITKAMCVTQEENKEDTEFLYPVVKKLVECVKVFSAELQGIKRENNYYDFSDISHFALSLLTDKDGNITPLAREISERYEEILIDEYQDTNKAQDMIFTSISKNGGNLFRVGDVKQSIYSFRQAMPEIFIDIRNRLDYFTGSNYPSKIVLDRNFRSRKSVTGYVNYIFSQLMSEKSSGVEYNKSEELVYGETYDETDDIGAEFHLIDYAQTDRIFSDRAEAQAQYVASLVKDILASGRMIKDGDTLRPVQKKDICILMRSVKTSGAVFAKALNEWNIDCYTEITGNFFEASEIKVMLSLLRVIDNPVQDIPLLSVMMSPIFAFTPDEMAQIRLSNPNGSLYSCLITSEGTNEKVASFLLFFRRMRFLAVTSTASSLIRRIYEETSFRSVVQAMKGSEKRKFNLKMLIDYADEYEKSGKTGVSGFIRFADKLIESRKEMDSSNPVSENADVVKIMTIHKSKGLEFPVCIVANLQKQFNQTDENSNMIINSRYGVGLKMRNPQNLSQYRTLSHSSASIMLRQSERAEELRILYVALTRARESLILVSGANDLEKTVSKLSCDIDLSRLKLAPFSVSECKCYGDWIIKALLRHKSAGELRKAAGMDESYIIPSDFELKIKLVESIKAYSGTKKITPGERRADEEYQKILVEKTSYAYPYGNLVGIPTKRSASNSESVVLDRENFALSVPEFLRGKSLSPAQKGTAMHRLVQCMDFLSARESIQKEIGRLVENKSLTAEQAQCIDEKRVKAFLCSRLCKRIENSSKVLKEKKFTVDVPITFFYPDKSENAQEKLMIQGIIDCAFEEKGKIILVDYKTDRVGDEKELTERYKKQLECYKNALEQITGLAVSEVYLYSFWLDREIKV